MLPDKDGLPDVAKVYAMARWGKGIIESEKTTRPTCRQLPRSPVPEVGALPVTTDSCHHTS